MAIILDFHNEESSIHTIMILWFYGYDSGFTRRGIINSYDDDSVILWIWFWISTTRNLQFIRQWFRNCMAMILNFHDEESSIHTIMILGFYGYDYGFQRREIFNSYDDDSVIFWLWFCDFHDEKYLFQTMRILWLYGYDSVIFTTRNLRYKQWRFCDFISIIP